MRKRFLDAAWGWTLSIGIHSVLLLGGSVAAFEFMVEGASAGTGVDCIFREGTPSIDRYERNPDLFDAERPKPEPEPLHPQEAYRDGRLKIETVYVGVGVCYHAFIQIFEEHKGPVRIVILPPEVPVTTFHPHGNRVRPAAQKHLLLPALRSRHALHLLGVEIDPACVDCVEAARKPRR